MNISVSSLGNAGTSLPVNGSLELQHVVLGIQQPLKHSVSIEGSAFNQGGVLWLELTISGALSLACERCGEPFNDEFAIDAEYRLDAAGSDNNDCDIAVIFITNETIDITNAVIETLMLELPEYYFCGCEHSDDIESKGANVFAALSELDLPIE